MILAPESRTNSGVVAEMEHLPLVSGLSVVLLVLLLSQAADFWVALPVAEISCLVHSLVQMPFLPARCVSSAKMLLELVLALARKQSLAARRILRILVEKQPGLRMVLRPPMMFA